MGARQLLHLGLLSQDLQDGFLVGLGPDQNGVDDGFPKYRKRTRINKLSGIADSGRQEEGPAPFLSLD